jgi:2,3-dihydro-2,3-dihydroxybenzoate dehydrogenase
VQAVLEVNVVGVVHVCRAVAARMRHHGGGAIVNVASGAAFRPYEGLCAYSASKGAVVSRTRPLALELAPSIRVDVVAPGRRTLKRCARPHRRSRVRPAAAAAVGMGRMAEPEEIAEAIVFLGSDRARFITGQVLPVNGGSFMR